jgi:hypothetical protein
MHSQWRSTRWAAPAVAVLLAACANPPQSPGNTRVAAPTAGASTTAPVNSTEAKAPAAQHTTAARPTRVGHRPIPAPSTTPALRPVNLKQFIDGDLPVLDDTEVSFFRGQRSCDASRRAVYMTEQFVVIEFNFHAPNAVGNCSLSIVNRSSLESPTGTHRIVALSNAQGVTEEAYLKSRPQFAIYSRNGMQPDEFSKVVFNSEGTRDESALRASERLFGRQGRDQLSALFRTQDVHRESVAQERLANPAVRRLVDECNVQAFQDHLSSHDAYLSYLGTLSSGEKGSKAPFGPSVAKFYGQTYTDARLKQGWPSVLSADAFARPRVEAELRSAATKEATALERNIAERARRPSAWAHRDITCTYAIAWNPGLYRANEKRMLVPSVTRGPKMDLTPIRQYRDAYQGALAALEPRLSQVPLATATQPSITFNFPGCPGLYFNSRRALEPVSAELGSKLLAAARATPSNELLLSLSFRFTHAKWIATPYGHGYVVDPDVALSRVRIHDLSGALLHTFGADAKFNCVGV